MWILLCAVYISSWFATLGAKLQLRWCSPCVSTCWEERVTAEAVAFLSQEWWTCSWKLRCPACVPCCPTSTWKTSRRSAVLFQLNELVVEKWWVRWDAAGCIYSIHVHSMLFQHGICSATRQSFLSESYLQDEPIYMQLVQFKCAWCATILMRPAATAISEILGRLAMSAVVRSKENLGYFGIEW